MGTPAVMGVLLLFGAGAGMLLLWPGDGVGARVMFCSLGAGAGVRWVALL